MVAKWLTSGRSKKKALLQREQPPIKVVPNALEKLPPNVFATISLFQNLEDQSLCINHFGTSQSGTTMHFALLAPSLADKAVVACRQITQECWYEQIRLTPHWTDSSTALATWVEAVQRSLVDFGGGSLTTALQGLTLDHESSKALFYFSGLAGAVLISKDDDIQHIAAPSETGLLGSPRSKSPSAQAVSTKSLAAIVLASDDFQQKDLERCIRKIRSIPYPKSGAAELLFFELRKKTNGSSILWIEF